MIEVFVVTALEQGWDCVVGVFETRRGAMVDVMEDEEDIQNKTDEELERIWMDSYHDRYRIHDKYLK